MKFSISRRAGAVWVGVVQFLTSILRWFVTGTWHSFTRPGLVVFLRWFATRGAGTVWGDLSQFYLPDFTNNSPLIRNGDLAQFYPPRFNIIPPLIRNRGSWHGLRGLSLVYLPDFTSNSPLIRNGDLAQFYQSRFTSISALIRDRGSWHSFLRKWTQPHQLFEIYRWMTTAIFQGWPKSVPEHTNIYVLLSFFLKFFQKY